VPAQVSQGAVAQLEALVTNKADGPIFQPIRTLRPFEDALHQIINAIRSEDLHIGDKLPSERVMARQLDVSRPTVREALRILMKARVLAGRRDGTSGLFVVGDTIPSELDGHIEPMSYQGVSELLEFRRMFEPRVAQLAGFRATEEDFAGLENTLNQLRAAQGDRARFLLRDERFQLRIAKATRNQIVVFTFTRLFRDLRLVRDLALREDSRKATEWAIGSLGRLLQALMSRDPDRIDREVSEHLEYLEGIWRRKTGRAVAYETPSFLMPRVSARTKT
jgi:GntR family transcriptional regulator, transcriptional repressor for pyruvate dehydrogenase complex